MACFRYTHWIGLDIYTGRGGAAELGTSLKKGREEEKELRDACKKGNGRGSFFAYLFAKVARYISFLYSYFVYAECVYRIFLHFFSRLAALSTPVPHSFFLLIVSVFVYSFNHSYTVIYVKRL